MAEVVVFPDAVSVTITYLKTALAGRTVDAGIGTRLPSALVGTFVRVFRTGGLVVERVVDQAQMTIEVYATETDTAHDVAQLVRGLLHAMEGTVQSGVPIYGVNEFAGPQDFPDPLTNKARYSFTVQVSMRGSAA